MAIDVVQAETSGGSGTSVSATWPAATTAGNFLVAVLGHNNGRTLTIPAPWTLRNSTSGGTTAHWWILEIPDAGSRSGVESFGFNLSGDLSIFLLELSGVDPTTPRDALSKFSGNGTTPIGSLPTGPNAGFALGVAEGVGGSNLGGADPTSPGWTGLSGYRASGGYKVLTSGGQVETLTLTNPVTWNGALASWNTTSGGGSDDRSGTGTPLALTLTLAPGTGTRATAGTGTALVLATGLTEGQGVKHAGGSGTPVALATSYDTGTGTKHAAAAGQPLDLALALGVGTGVGDSPEPGSGNGAPLTLGLGYGLGSGTKHTSGAGQPLPLTTAYDAATGTKASGGDGTALPLGLDLGTAYGVKTVGGDGASLDLALVLRAGTGRNPAAVGIPGQTLTAVRQPPNHTATRHAPTLTAARQPPTYSARRQP